MYRNTDQSVNHKIYSDNFEKIFGKKEYNPNVSGTYIKDKDTNELIKIDPSIPSRRLIDINMEKFKGIPPVYVKQKV